MLAVGQIIGRYRIEASLGHGAMGTVYRAVDESLRRPVALKVLGAFDGQELGDEEAKARFLREARAVAQLSHPNVVAVYDVGEIDGRPYIAMELVTGTNLRALAEDRSIPLGARIGWLVDVARALGATHDAGLVHRDVKPENVLVGSDGRAKLADFGIAKPVGADRAPASFRTKTGQLVGTPDYMAPEQWSGGDVDTRADQYAWGLVAYELLTSRPLPLGRPAPIASVAPEVPVEVAACVTRAIEHDRALRFASMHAIVTTLEANGASLSLSPAAAAAELGSAPTVAAPSRPSGPRAPGGPTGPMRRSRPTTKPAKDQSRVFVLAVALTVAAAGLLVAVVVAFANRLARISPATEAAAPLGLVDAGGAGGAAPSFRADAPVTSASEAVDPSSSAQAARPPVSPHPPGAIKIVEYGCAGQSAESRLVVERALDAHRAHLVECMRKATTHVTETYKVQVRHDGALQAANGYLAPLDANVEPCVRKELASLRINATADCPNGFSTIVQITSDCRCYGEHRGLCERVDCSH